MADAVDRQEVLGDFCAMTGASQEQVYFSRSISYAELER